MGKGNQKDKEKITRILVSKPYPKHLDLTRSKKIKSFPLLKNGSRAMKLKAYNVKDLRKVILSNICAFGTIASILMAAYCDSLNYSTKVNNLTSKIYCWSSSKVLFKME